MTPKPLGSFSIFLMGPGFKISKNLNAIKPIKPVLIVTGNIVKTNHWPTHSSITILDGSCSLESSMIIFDEIIPKIKRENVINGNM